MKVTSVLIGLALQFALWLAAPVEASPVREQDPARALAVSPAPAGRIADLAATSLAARISFSRVVATVQAWRSTSDVRHSSALIDTDAQATRIAMAGACARLVVISGFACTEAVATFATWLPPPVLQFRSF